MHLRFLENFLFIKTSLLIVCICGWSGPMLHGQAAPAGFSRPGNLQVGVTVNLAGPDYGPDTLKGFGVYSTFDFKHDFGVEAEFHQLNDPGAKYGIYERNYEIGPRYVMHFGPLMPYAKMMIGRGVFNFPPSPQNPAAGAVANLAYNMWAGGFGTDYRVKPSINVRFDYELQRWRGFPPNGLSPRVFSMGVAYHFH